MSNVFISNYCMGK